MADLEMWKEYAYVTKEAEVLVATFMPGPLTIVLRKKKTVPDLLNPLALAARIPGHSVALGLVKKTGFPITSTSANISGQPATYSVEDLDASVRSAADVVLDAGPLPIARPSTIIDLTEVNKPRIVRKGPISEEDILAVLMEE
jgi:L-threonylcarbamoyladenylate synthase